MGRAKLKMEFIANKKNRKKTYSERLRTLKKSIYEFSELCGVDACMIIYDPDQDKPEICLENMNEVQRITKRYLQIPKEKRDKLILDDKKKERTREYDEMPMSRQVNGFSINQLEQLRSKLGSKIEILSEKIQSMDGVGAGMSNEAPQKEYPCYNPERASDHEPTTTTTWKSDTTALEPLSYTRPMDVILSDFPPMFFNNASDMMAPVTQPMSSFNFENFCSGGISNESNFSYTDAMDTQMMMLPSTGCREMEIGSHLGASPWFLQPSLLQ